MAKSKPAVNTTAPKASAPKYRFSDSKEYIARPAKKLTETIADPSPEIPADYSFKKKGPSVHLAKEAK